MSYVDPPDNDFFMNGKKKDCESLSEDDEWDYETTIHDFESMKSVRNLPIGVSDQLIERYVRVIRLTILSVHNVKLILLV